MNINDIISAAPQVSEEINRIGDIEFSQANMIAWDTELAQLTPEQIAAWYRRVDNHAQRRLYLVIARVLPQDRAMGIIARLYGSADRIKGLEAIVADQEAKIAELRNSAACQVEVNGRLYDRATTAEAKLQSIRQVLT